MPSHAFVSPRFRRMKTRSALRALGLLGAFAGLTMSARAQDQVGSIRGRITDKDFGGSVVDVHVQIVESAQSGKSNDQGSYVIGEVKPGKYTLIFSKEGYVRQVRADVVVAPSRLTDLDIALTGDFEELEEVVVQESLQLGGSSEASLLQLRFDSPALMDSVGADLMSRAGAGDAASGLRLVAGATVQDGKSAVIRGLPDRYVSSQMNGVRLPSANEDKRAVELDQFPSVVIESLQVTKTFTPDQQGDASGGAVNVRLKGVPDEPFFVKYSATLNVNDQVAGRGNFLSYQGAGPNFWGRDNGQRAIQSDNLGGNWDGAVGISTTDAPSDYKWSLATGGKIHLTRDVKIGGFGSFFYERDASFYDNGVDDSFWVETPGGPMVPRTFQGAASGGDFKTGLFDITRAVQGVKWGGLGAIGLDSKHHTLRLTYLRTHSADDATTLAEDTRGKEFFFPGYDPGDPSTPGHAEPDAAPYLRLETLAYTERATSTLQLHGRHDLADLDLFGVKGPELDWTVSLNTATNYEPDKRQFGSIWIPERNVGGVIVPPTHLPFRPAATFSLGNLQRIWRSIDERSEQYAVNLKLPVGDEGAHLKFGSFRDVTKRSFDQDTFSNSGESGSFVGDFDQFWSRQFPFENHTILASEQDVDYRGSLEVSAWYAMLDVPLFDDLTLVGGVRFETTDLRVMNSPEREAFWFPPGAAAPVTLNPGDGDVDLHSYDVLPAIALEYRPYDDLTFRAAYTQTIARQTFKEVTPILQQEFLGGPIFIGNPDLGLASLQNYDLRVDWTPYEGGLVSASWFKKDIEDPIEYVQRIVSFNFTTAVNYPHGQIDGFEFEARQDLGVLADSLEGFSVGANATLIHSIVRLTDAERTRFASPAIGVDLANREMTNAPDHLVNLYLTYDLPETGTRASLFYTIQGDTLITGAGESVGNFVPSIYAKTFDTLNFNITQRLTSFMQLSFGVKNITNPEIETVYRSKFIGSDVRQTSFTRGIEYSIGIGGELRF
jgi:outer membrane receptor protein involved in Fe transport